MWWGNVKSRRFLFTIACASHKGIPATSRRVLELTSWIPFPDRWRKLWGCMAGPWAAKIVFNHMSYAIVFVKTGWRIPYRITIACSSTAHALSAVWILVPRILSCKRPGREQYSKRMWTVEPVFGNITSNKRLDRFSLRGKAKVTGQWLLYCLVHNIEKLWRYGPELKAT